MTLKNNFDLVDSEISHWCMVTLVNQYSSEVKYSDLSFI